MCAMPATPGGVNDVFTYTIKDGDGDLSHTTLTIAIGDARRRRRSRRRRRQHAPVYEAGLAARGGEPAGSNERRTARPTTGTIGFTAPTAVPRSRSAARR